MRGGTHFWNAPECLDSCNDEELKRLLCINPETYTPLASY